MPEHRVGPGRWQRVEATRQRTSFDRGVPAVGGRLGAVPVTRFLGEPGDGPVTVRSVGQQLFVQHALAEGWSLQGGAAYRDSALEGYSTEASELLADGRTFLSETDSEVVAHLVARELEGGMAPREAVSVVLR